MSDLFSARQTSRIHFEFAVDFGLVLSMTMSWPDSKGKV